VIESEHSDKLPLEFDIEHLQMTRVGPGQPMHFEADLINPKPVGNIHSIGSFGPWEEENPRKTPVHGSYSFRDADLSTIKGIGGILSSTGQYAGALDRIVVDGTTETPDFRVAVSGRPVPLHTEFHALVDGTSGDTYLEPVKAKLVDSWLVATGSVVRTKPHGHNVQLDVAIENGRIEDLLRLATRRDPPIMSGTVQLKTQFELPPGEPDLANRLILSGQFGVTRAHFADVKIQDKIDALSRRSLGHPKQTQLNSSDDVRSKLTGIFRLSDGLLTFSRLQFQIPGARVNLAGTYNLDGKQFDFHGHAMLDAKLSQMVSGWKSFLLKPADPFFRRDGAGTVLPIKITGDNSELHFGTDFFHRNGD
jgi:AsmA-like C-terminal region